MGSRTFTLLTLACRTSKMKIIILLCALVVTITSYPVKEESTTTVEPEISTIYDFCKAICDAGGCGAPLCDCGCPPYFQDSMIDTTKTTTTKKPITTTTIPTTTTTTTTTTPTTTEDFCEHMCKGGDTCGAPLCDCGCPPGMRNMPRFIQSKWLSKHGSKNRGGLKP